MTSRSSVTGWVHDLLEGDPDAAQKLWERYFKRLVGLARVKLKALPCRGYEEDVALSAFDSFFRGATKNRFPRLDDRNNLWKLLVTITARKAYHLQEHEGRQKRGGREHDDPTPGSRATDDSVSEIIASEPTPEFAAQAAEEYQRLLAALPDEGLRTLAQCKMESYTNEEIAAKLGCSLRGVERKLRLIRSCWEPREART
jgi:RNA polymerase sigma factor (sigma-70 family)